LKWPAGFEATKIMYVLLANELEAVVALDLPEEHLNKGRRKHCRRMMCATACPSVNLRKKSFRSCFSLKPRSRDVCNLKVSEMTD
jgi:hypothetical protein